MINLKRYMNKIKKKNLCHSSITIDEFRINI